MPRHTPHTATDADGANTWSRLGWYLEEAGTYYVEVTENAAAGPRSNCPTASVARY